ncbi:alkaline phosphatase family protein [Paroceanicella profunda]|uniref:Alkaline phosphatase family protein n=1 Tax=Paroceanicella profunda TaxID=2579971 RepID=A0A5B8FXE1_9RHOB|nr:alkaline phosphatase family protein [Paroceanicella profunda]QDL91880.1 alkaline phosphatase family protein [Paroceanicella profunda]
MDVTGARRAVIVVFDGLRPDMVTPELMPELAGFAAGAAWFREARSVFPSYTRVATTSIATGSWPRRHGIVGNQFHQPGLIAGGPLDTSNYAHLEAAAVAWPGGAVGVEDLGTSLARAGKRLSIVHCGSAGSAFLLNSRVLENGHWTFSIHGEAHTRTPGAVRASVARHGPLPGPELPKIGAVERAAQVVCDTVLAEQAPDVAIVWFPEPDTSFHYCRIGSEDSRRALAACDTAFARIRAALGPDTLLIAMSDHGQITVDREVDLGAALRAAGFRASDRPGEGDVFGYTRGAAGELRLLSDRPDPAAVSDLAAWAMEQDWLGLLFSRDGLPGTLPLAAVMGDHPRAPDLVYACRSDRTPDPDGLPGRGAFTGGVPLMGGMHGGLNRHELTTLLALSGPGITPGERECPAGIVDVMPTVLAALGVPQQGAEGRVLEEAWGAAPAAVERLYDRARAGRFAQELQRLGYRDRVYLHEGARL